MTREKVRPSFTNCVMNDLWIGEKNKRAGHVILVGKLGSQRFATRVIRFHFWAFLLSKGLCFPGYLKPRYLEYAKVISHCFRDNLSLRV